MNFIVWLWIRLFGRTIAPETPVEIYFLGISYFRDRTDKELSFMRHGTWSEFSFLKRKLPVGDFGIGNPIVILESYELPSEVRHTNLFTKTEFDSQRKALSS